MRTKQQVEEELIRTRMKYAEAFTKYMKLLKKITILNNELEAIRKEQ